MHDIYIAFTSFALRFADVRKAYLFLYKLTIISKLSQSVDILEQSF